MRQAWTITLRRAARTGDALELALFALRSERDVHRVRTAQGFLSVNAHVAERVLELLRNGSFGWATVGSFLDGQQVIRPIHKFMPVMDCSVHRRHLGETTDSELRCLDPDCISPDVPFEQDKKAIKRFRERELAKEGANQWQ